ncbi:DUF7694 domain-containing protein [Microvirga massiliensis]|uniref:DUF7694 domain-containing protein n=1 Tax=Microvirga massiliensis TaxID=1033741 RepID=UPI00069CAFB7|nr:hypothetical protein [Microvirga massiliensis]
MIDLRLLDLYRDRENELGCYGPGSTPSQQGLFRIPHVATAVTLTVVASTREGWDHVSVSLPNRCPDWPEMSFIAKLFFADQPAMQLHVPEAEHVNVHRYCLHWWSPNDGREIPRPPQGMVG